MFTSSTRAAGVAGADELTLPGRPVTSVTGLPKVAGGSRDSQGKRHRARTDIPRTRTASRLPGVLDSGDVIEVVDRVVNEVPGERLDGELGPVAAAAGAGPLISLNRGESRRDRLGGLG